MLSPGCDLIAMIFVKILSFHHTAIKNFSISQIINKSQYNIPAKN